MYKNPKAQGNKNHHLNIATVDHLHPQSKGGTNQKENMVLACGFCNSVLKASKEKFVGFRVQKPQYFQKIHYQEIKKYITYQSQIKYLNSLKKLIEEDKIDLAMDSLEEHKNVLVLQRPLNLIIEFIQKTLKTIDSIILQIKTIFQYIIKMIQNYVDNLSKLKISYPIELIMIDTSNGIINTQPYP